MRYRNHKKNTDLLNTKLVKTQAGEIFALTHERNTQPVFHYTGVFKKMFLLIFIFSSLSLFSQNVVINEQGVSTSTNPSTTVLDLSASQLGFLLPTMTTTSGITSPATGLMIFNSSTNCYETYSVANATWQPYWCFCVGPPTAPTFAANPVTICKGGSQTFSISNASSTNAVSYVWTVQSTLTNPASTITSGQGTSSIVLPVTSTAATYTITVTSTNACGTATSATLSVVVESAGGTPTVTPSSNTPVCSGNTVTLFANATNSPTSYAWTPSAGLSCNTCADPTITGVAGSVTYSVTATNGCGTSTQGTTAVTVNATPTITSVTATAATICEGSSSTLAVLPTPAGSTYAWSPNTNLNNTTGSSITANPSATTTYSVTETSSLSCTSASSSVTLTVNPAPTSPTITTAYRDPCGGTQIAKGQTIDYTITAAANCTYSWTPTGGTVTPTTGTSVNVTWTTNGTESISVLATNTLTGCVAASSYTLSVTVAATASCTYSSTGLSAFIVPTGITTCTIDAYGAQGGQAYTNTALGTGGLGAHAHAVVVVSGGTTLNCYVGAQGNTPASSTVVTTGGTGGNSDENGGSGYGGANTNWSNATGLGAGGGGGGASCVRLSTNATLFADDIISAAGGGGVGLDGKGASFNTPENGGNGGGLGSLPTVGGDGYSATEAGNVGAAGGGGAATIFGCGSANNTSGTAGSVTSGDGGNGGETDKAVNIVCPNYAYGGGGGGGGGHDAGGGGCGGGGGGGYSSTAGFGANTTSATSVTAGIETGNGEIIITW